PERRDRGSQLERHRRGLSWRPDGGVMGGLSSVEGADARGGGDGPLNPPMLGGFNVGGGGRGGARGGGAAEASGETIYHALPPLQSTKVDFAASAFSRVFRPTASHTGPAYSPGASVQAWGAGAG